VCSLPANPTHRDLDSTPRPGKSCGRIPGLSLDWVHLAFLELTNLEKWISMRKILNTGTAKILNAPLTGDPLLDNQR